MATHTVLSVGQCGVDHPAIRRLLQREFDAEVVPADSAEEALGALRKRPFDLVLVNRVFDAGGCGMDFIALIKADESLSKVPVMLVSDLSDAQRQALEMGALPGFGKSALHHQETAERLAAALGENDSTER